MTLVKCFGRRRLHGFGASFIGLIILATALLVACQTSVPAAEPDAGERTDSGKAKWREILTSRQ